MNPYTEAGVDTAAGDLAVELMKSAVRRTHGPEVLGGVGGFAGLFDASALRTYARPAAGHEHRRRRHEGRDRAGDRQARHDRSRPGRHGRRRHRRGRRQAAVHDRLHRVRQGLPRAHRRHRRGHRARAAPRPAPPSSAARPPSTRASSASTTTTSRARRPVWSRPTASSAPTACVRATSCSPSRAAACTRTATRSCGTSSPAAASSTADSAAEFGTTWGEALLEPTRLYTAPLLRLIAGLGDGVHALSHVTGGGIAANLARVLPQQTWVEVDRSTWSPPPVFRVLADLGDLQLEATEGTWNLGIGFVAIVAAERADAAVSALAQDGIATWQVGVVARRRAARRRARTFRAGRQGRGRRRGAPGRNLQQRRSELDPMCGIVGMVGQGSVNQEIYDALLLLQHRGQDSTGIATAERNGVFHLVQGEGSGARGVPHPRHARPSRRHRPRPCPLRDQGHGIQRRRGAAVLRERALRHRAGAQRQPHEHPRAHRRAVPHRPPAPEHQQRHRAAGQRAGQ